LASLLVTEFKINLPEHCSFISRSNSIFS